MIRKPNQSVSVVLMKTIARLIPHGNKESFSVRFDLAPPFVPIPARAVSIEGKRDAGVGFRPGHRRCGRFALSLTVWHG